MAAMSNEYMVVIRHHNTGYTLSYDFPTLEEATRTAANWRKYTYGHARVEVVRASSESDPDWNDPSERGAWVIPELEVAVDAYDNDRLYVPSDPVLKMITELRAVDATPSRRKVDPYLTWLLAWAAVLVGGVVLILTGAAVATWNALVQLFTAHPVITDNAIGAALTITGLAVIRHLRTHPREK